MQKRIRIAILGTRGIPARYGGFERFAEEVGAGLAGCGLDVMVVCERQKGQPITEKYRGMTLRRLSAPHLGALTTLWFDLVSLIRFARGYDLVYMLGYGTAWAFPIPRLCGTPVLTNMDGLEWKRSKWSRFARWYLRVMERCALITSTAVIADANAVRDSLESRHGALRRCWVVPYGAYVVDEPPVPAQLHSRNLTAGGYYLVVCRLEPENHVEEIIRGFLAAGSSRDLVIVGDHHASPYSNRLLRLAGPHVQFLGTLYEEPTLSCLRYHCAAYLHGHSVGGTNPSLLEALGCGNIVVCHDNPFNREVVGDKGLYFRSSVDVTRVLRDIEAGKLESWSRNTMQDLVRSRFSWDRIVEQYVAIVLELTGRSRQEHRPDDEFPSGRNATLPGGTETCSSADEPVRSRT